MLEIITGNKLEILGLAYLQPANKTIETRCNNTFCTAKESLSITLKLTENLQDHTHRSSSHDAVSSARGSKFVNVEDPASDDFK
jgi:hypothetical protein